MALHSQGASAQTGAQIAPVPRQYETRQQLEAQIRAAEAQNHGAEAFLLRSRLQKGDFQEGDRIVLTMESTGRTDTAQVRAGRVLQFVGMADLSLEGVLRSELSDTLRSHFSKYLVNPNVRATPLVPIGVLGSVNIPGYYYTTADVVLRDLIMRAGGFGNGDLRRTVVRRGGETIWNAADVRAAIAEGLSVDRLHLRAGDEIYVPEKRRVSVGTVLSIVSASTTLLFLILRRY